MSAPSTTTAAPAASPAPAIDLAAGKDLTSLDDAALAADLGLVAPEGAADEAADVSSVEDDIVSQSAKAVAGTPDEAASDEPDADDTTEPETPNAETQTADQPADKPAPVAQFTVFDSDGELEVPELFLNFTADGGKEFTKVPLDKVVRLAQQGVYNHRLQQEVQSVRETQQRLSQAEDRAAQIQALADQRLALAERLLTDPDFFDRAAQEYEAYNAPDAQLERLRAENEALKQGRAHPSQQPQDDGPQWFDQTVMPTVDAITKATPLVTGQELLGQFMLVTSPLLVNGKIPPQARDRVAAMIANELAPWAQQLQEMRAQDQTQRSKAAKAADRAKVNATVVKRQLARATKPAGKPARDVPRGRPATNADDAANDILAGLFPA